MIFLALAALIALLWNGPASAEALLAKAGMGALTEYAETHSDVDIRQIARDMISGSLPVDQIDASACFKRFAALLRSSLTEVLKVLAAPVLVSLALRALLGTSEAGGTMVLLCRAGCALVLMERFVQAREIADAALSATTGLIDIAAPVLVSVLTLTGAENTATVLTPTAALCAKLVAEGLRGAGLPLCGVAATVAAAANLTDRFPLNRLFALLKRAVSWGVSFMLAGFVGLMALQGLVVSGQDALTTRLANRAIRAMLPIIGGEVSASSGALLGSVLAVRRAAGVAGMLAALAVCAMPVAKLLLSALSLKLAAALLEPLADSGVVRIAGQFSDVTQMLLALCAGGALLSMLCLGACLAMAG